MKRDSSCLLTSTAVLIFLASRIRGKVAQVPFDEFHRYSTSIIKKAVFGVDKDGNVKQRLRFDANQLVRKRIISSEVPVISSSFSETVLFIYLFMFFLGGG